MSSRWRWCACLRAWASSLVVFNSSTVTRRPRSAMRSIAFLLSSYLSSFYSTSLRGAKRRSNPVRPRRAGLLRFARNDDYSSARPTLPHAELENGKIGSFQQSARRNHDVGGGNRIFRDRHDLLAGFAARGIDPARGRDQFLQRFGGHHVEIAVDDAALERGGNAHRIGRGAAGARYGDRFQRRPDRGRAARRLCHPLGGWLCPG